MDTTSDGLLNRRVLIEQPAKGYRVAVDTVLLAAAIPVQAGEKVLDAGCGVGGVMLCLACRVPEIFITGIDIQKELADLCRHNIAYNAFPSEMKVEQGDVTQLPETLSGFFDHVAMNPPYHDEARHDVSAHAGKRMANAEKDGDLKLWIENAARTLRSSGMLTLIHRADRQEEILKTLQPFFGAIEILPILPKEGTAPKRVIIRARKGEKTWANVCRSFILHKPDGGYTDEAEAVLRHAKPLEFRS